MERDAKVSDESLLVSSLDFWGKLKTGCPFIHPWECVWTPAVSVGMKKQQCEPDELVTRKNEELAVEHRTRGSGDIDELRFTVLQPKPAETRVWLSRCGSLIEDTQTAATLVLGYMSAGLYDSRDTQWSTMITIHSLLWLHYIWTWGWTVHTSHVWLSAL